RTRRLLDRLRGAVEDAVVEEAGGFLLLADFLRVARLIEKVVRQRRAARLVVRVGVEVAGLAGRFDDELRREGLAEILPLAGAALVGRRALTEAEHADVRGVRRLVRIEALLQ